MRAAVTVPDVRPVSRLFKALADETRVRIVALLSHGELCVCHVEAALDLSQPNASRHLSILRAAEVVETRRQANWVYYRLAKQDDPGRKAQLRGLVNLFSKHELLRQDVARLVTVKGPMSCP
jgi:ArsR family transcriptional regulator